MCPTWNSPSKSKINPKTIGTLYNNKRDIPSSLPISTPCQLENSQRIPCIITKPLPWDNCTRPKLHPSTSWPDRRRRRVQSRKNCHPKSNNTWEPADQVHTPQLIHHYQSTAPHQSSIKEGCVKPYQSTGMNQSAATIRHLKEGQPTLQSHIECPMIFPASLSNTSLKTFLSNSSLPSNTSNTTLTPLSHTPLASSVSTISLAPNMSLTIGGIANSTTAHSTTPTKACPMPQSMP